MEAATTDSCQTSTTSAPCDATGRVLLDVQPVTDPSSGFGAVPLKRWSVHRQSLWIIGLQAINVSSLNHRQASAVSQRENASSPLKLQPPIYYVYVYKSLRRPRIPGACKKSREREEEQEGGSEDVRRDEGSGRGDITSQCFISSTTRRNLLGGGGVQKLICWCLQSQRMTLVSCVCEASLISSTIFINLRLNPTARGLIVIVPNVRKYSQWQYATILL